MQELHENINTGFLAQEPEPKDWMFGGETGIALETVNASRDWTESLPTDERQGGVYFDSMACVTFSALNSIETQINFLLWQNKIPAATVMRMRELGYIDSNGRVNFSDRFTAKMSGTTRMGNYLTNVWNSIKNHGLLPEKDWAFPNEQRQPVFDWDDYYAEPPQSIKDKAKEFLKLFDVAYEWVAIDAKKTPTEQIKQNLAHAPLQIASPLCYPWNGDGVIPSCPLVKATHATLIYGFEEGKLLKDFDHYKPFRKSIAWDYPINYVMKGIVTPRSTMPQPTPAKPPAKFKHKFQTDLVFGMTSNEVVKLQEALKADGVFPPKVRATGYYGNTTREAVISFQIKHSVTSLDEINSLNGRRVGPKTRAKLNELYG